jgi:hypothetical protein
MPPNAVHFNGSVNLADAETVMREITTRVPRGVRRLIDGETGDRTAWIGYQLPVVLATPGLEPVEPEPAVTNFYGERRRTARLAPATEPDAVRWPDLGYARAYIESYATFDRLRREGVVPGNVRLQVQYPTPFAVSGFFHSSDRARLLPSYEKALLADLDRVVAAVPHEDLAVQWDVATEFGILERAPERLDGIATAIGRHLDHLPEDVPVGLHLCYGDAGHQHFLEPPSLAAQVRLTNTLIDRSGRAPSWISFTVPQDRADDGYFSPLAELRTGPDTELYFALVAYHPDTQPPGTTKTQVAMVDTYLPGDAPWGICLECGLGRTDPGEIPRLLDLHREILDEFSPAGRAP